jgi:spermidine/putrescine-binding protein
MSGDRAPSAAQRSGTEFERLVASVAEGEMSRREFLRRAAALGVATSAVATVLAACGAGEPAATGTSASPAALDTTLPDKLYLFNWADYLPQSVKDKFQKKYGIKVVETYFEDNEALLTKLKAGTRGYDLAVPSDYMVTILAKSGLLVPLHMDLIPNFANVMPRFQKPSYDTWPDGRKYSVPYDWGTTGIGVRIDAIHDSITKWADLWNPAYKGRIQMLSDEREVVGACLKMLGYSYNSTDPQQIDEAVAKCIEQKPLVVAYNSNTTRRALVGGTPLVQGWDGWVLMAYDELGPKKLDYVLPAEGYCLYSDTFVVPVGGPSPYAAHLFMDFVLDPKINAECINYTWYHTAVPAATPYLDEIVLSFVPTEEELTRGEELKDLGAANQLYTEAWTKIRTA